MCRCKRHTFPPTLKPPSPLIEFGCRAPRVSGAQVVEDGSMVERGKETLLHVTLFCYCDDVLVALGKVNSSSVAWTSSILPLVARRLGLSGL